ncbi:MAG: hypothetical protein R3F02_00100 [Thiolinea sp.]
MIFLPVLWCTHATAAGLPEQLVAIPDYGKNDCVSFKRSSDTNPLEYTHGYACVSEHYCEVFDHGCVGEACDSVDYSKGTRTTTIAIPMLTKISQILMAPMGVSLRDEQNRWCLIQDGAGNFWSLDKLRGSGELFTLENLQRTVVRCKPTDLFSSQTGCVADE